jgi:hypothetical protein
MVQTALKTRTVELSPILTMSVKVEKFPEDVKGAFSSLGNKLHTKTGRKFFGAVNVGQDSIDYQACLVQKDKFEHIVLGLQNYMIPGGKYVTNKLVNWSKNTHLIKEMFGEMEHRFRFDAQRPQLEYYKSNRELILLLPIIPREEQLKMSFD